MKLAGQGHKDNYSTLPQIPPPKLTREPREPPCPDRLAHRLHQLLVERQIMLGQQHCAEDFAGLGQVVEIGAAVVAAGIARATLVQRGQILGVFCVAQIERAVPGEGLAVAARAAGQDAIEHIDPALDRADQVIGLAHSHQIARLVRGQLPRREVEAGEHRLLPLPDRESADGIAIEADLDQRRGGLLAEARVQRALLDPEDRGSSGMLAAAIERVARSLGPADRAVHRVGLRVLGCGGRDELVELHDDVAAVQTLDFDRALGAEHVARSVEVAGKGDPLLAYLGEVAE